MLVPLMLVPLMLVPLNVGAVPSAFCIGFTIDSHTFCLFIVDHQPFGFSFIVLLNREGFVTPSLYSCDHLSKSRC